MKENDYGKYYICNNVYEDIAQIACLNTKNVYPAKADKMCANCSIDSTGDMVITLAVKLAQGIDLVKTCKAIQDNVKENIMMMTGDEIRKINIDIQGFIKESK